MVAHPLRIDDPDDIVENLYVGLSYLVDRETEQAILLELKKCTFVGEPVCHFSWHHAMQLWNMAVYGEDDRTKGIVYEFDRDDVSIPPPKPPVDPPLLRVGRYSLFRDEYSREVEKMVDELMELCPDVNRNQVAEMVDGWAARQYPLVRVMVDNQPYNLVPEENAFDWEKADALVRHLKNQISELKKKVDA